MWITFVSVEVVRVSVCGISKVIYTPYIDALYDAFMHFMKFVHFVLEISAIFDAFMSGKNNG